MRQSKFTEPPIVSILNEADAGRPVNEIWRQSGISFTTYYKWNAKYGGLGLAMEIDTALPAERVLRVLEQVVSWRGQPRAIQPWHIEPGKPDQNAFIERSNRTYRTEVLNAYLFESLEQVREISAEWLQSDNEERPDCRLTHAKSAINRRTIKGPCDRTSFGV